MPPKIQHTKEKITAAAMEVIRESGAENLNARMVAKKLGCSTQPVMYHFKTIEELKRSAYQEADAYHTEYLMRTQAKEPMLGIGLNYIRFAAREKNLFRFLFQTNGMEGRNLTELIEAGELKPVMDTLVSAAGVEREQAKLIFRSLCMIAHGYASMLANNEMEYDEAAVRKDLEFIFYGALAASKEQSEKGHRERGQEK